MEYYIKVGVRYLCRIRTTYDGEYLVETHEINRRKYELLEAIKTTGKLFKLMEYKKISQNAIELSIAK